MSTNERTEDFEFMFDSLKTTIADLFNGVFDPTVLICDAAKSIHNGFENVFPSLIGMIIMCWAHMRRAMVNNLPKYIRDQKKQNEFLRK